MTGCRNLQTNKGNNKITELRTILQRESQNSFYLTEYGTALTTILPILFLYLNTVIVTAETLNRNERGRFGALISDSTHQCLYQVRVITVFTVFRLLTDTK
jgi:hypothetical protein